jgi:hypothetical protein
MGLLKLNIGACIPNNNKYAIKNNGLDLGLAFGLTPLLC